MCIATHAKRILLTDLGIDTNRFAHADIGAMCHVLTHDTISPTRLADHVCMRVILADAGTLIPCLTEHRSFDFQELAIFDRSIKTLVFSQRPRVKSGLCNLQYKFIYS